jgi:ankyrin repeat protein
MNSENILPYFNFFDYFEEYKKFMYNNENKYNENYYSISQAFCNTFKFFHDNNINISQEDNLGNTLLFYAFDCKHYELVKILINYNLKINKNIEQTILARIYFDINFNYDIFKFLITNNYKDEKGLIFFHAVNNENYEICNLLISSNAVDINVRNNLYENALRYAKSNNMIYFLLSKNIDIYAKNKHGRNILFFLNNVKMIELFLNLGMDINTVDKYGNTPIMFYYNISILEYIINRGAILESQNIDGDTALTKTNNINKIKFLIKKGANINHQNKAGQTILIKSQIYNIFNKLEINDKIAKLLIRNKANIHLVDKFGKNVFFYTKSNSIACLLFMKKIDINHKDNSGNYAPFREFFLINK